MVYLILWSEGQINLKETKNECAAGGWVPVLAYRPKDQPEAPPKLIGFEDPQMAHQFAQRNISRAQQKQGYLRGAVYVTTKTSDWIAAQGWEIERRTWAHKMVDDSRWELFNVIVEFQEKPEDREVRVSTGGIEGLRKY